MTGGRALWRRWEERYKDHDELWEQFCCTGRKLSWKSVAVEAASGRG